jgi:hypothetical protein
MLEKGSRRLSPERPLGVSEALESIDRFQGEQAAEKILLPDGGIGQNNRGCSFFQERLRAVLIPNLFGEGDRECDSD